MTDKDSAIKFLLGEGPLEGCWFGEKPETERGNFWWRKHLRAALSKPGEVTEGQLAAAKKAYDAARCGGFRAEHGAMRAALTAALGAQKGGETDDDAEYNAHMEAQVREVYEWLRKRGLYDPRDYPEDEGPDVCELLDLHESELCRQIPEDGRTPLQRAMDAISAQTRGEGAAVRDSLTAADRQKAGEGAP